MISSKFLVTSVLSLVLTSQATPVPHQQYRSKTNQLETEKHAFYNSSLVPDALPNFQPQGVLEVFYNSTKLAIGQEISPSLLSVQPVVCYKPESGEPKFDSHKYLLAAIDPDGGKYADVLHWLRTDITIGKDGALSTGDVNAAYFPPSPPAGTGSHRYTFLLYQEPANFSLPSQYTNLPPDISLTGPRVGVNFTAFREEAGLMRSPIGGLFFKAEADAKS